MYYSMPVAIRFPIPCTVAGDDEEFIGVYCWVLGWNEGWHGDACRVLLLWMTESVYVSLAYQTTYDFNQFVSLLTARCLFGPCFQFLSIEETSGYKMEDTAERADDSSL